MSQEPEVSVVMPLRNRTGTLVENTLRSLRWQDVDPALVEIVFSDFGSDPEAKAWIADAADRYGGRVVYRETSEVWNRSKALNVGVKASRGKYVFAVDSDILYAPNFITSALRLQKEADDQLFLICMCRDLPEELEGKEWSKEQFDGLLDLAPYRVRIGTGACQFARREFFFDVRGYDEGYKFWGGEDGDMVSRAEQYGLTLRWLHDRSEMLHQWHPSDRRKKPFRKLLNDLRYHATKRIVRKNLGGWG